MYFFGHYYTIVKYSTLKSNDPVVGFFPLSPIEQLIEILLETNSKVSG